MSMEILVRGVWLMPPMVAWHFHMADMPRSSLKRVMKPSVSRQWRWVMLDEWRGCLLKAGWLAGCGSQPPWLEGELSGLGMAWQAGSGWVSGWWSLGGCVCYGVMFCFACAHVWFHFCRSIWLCASSGHWGCSPSVCVCFWRAIQCKQLFSCLLLEQWRGNGAFLSGNACVACGVGWFFLYCQNNYMAWRALIMNNNISCTAHATILHFFFCLISSSMVMTTFSYHLLNDMKLFLVNN